MGQSKPFLEKAFEAILWKTRLMVLLAVISGIAGAFGLFILGSYEIFHTISTIFPLEQSAGNYGKILIGIIGAVDLFLIGIVLLLFSFGIYELFVSKIDIARLHNEIKILEIGTLDELKNKVLKVVVVVLIVTFFKVVLTASFSTPVELLYFAISIVAISIGVYLLRKKEDTE
jgi:uncharacterized membrane protein YqhA